MVKKFLLLVAASMLLGSCNDEEVSNNVPKLELTRSTEIVRDQTNAFALKLFSRTNACSEGNIFLSPLSSEILLSMVANGAEGETYNEIVKTLGMEGMPYEEVNSFNQMLLTNLPNIDKKVELSTANGLWVNKQVKINEDYGKSMRTMYDADVRSIDFSSVDQINSWCKKKTKGNIEKLFTESLPSNTNMVIVNAIYFNGLWSSPFMKADTKQEVFYNMTGKKNIVPMMHKSFDELLYQEEELFSIVRIPYGNKQYNMYVILPKEQDGLDQCIDYLSEADHFEETLRDMVPCTVVYSMPKFDFSYEFDLKEIVRQLGINKVFEPDASLNTISDIPAYVSVMKQIAHVTVDEEGTKAQVVSHASLGDLMALPGMMVTMNVNHPFAFIIIEETTGTILFAGGVKNI